MDSKIKRIKIKDGGNVKEFTVRLFGVTEGLDFIDKFLGDMASFVKTGQGISIRKVMADLLPLAGLIGPDGNVQDEMSYDKLDNYFENPLSAIELAIGILEHQMVFMNESELFRQYRGKAKAMFNIQSSGSATQSEI